MPNLVQLALDAFKNAAENDAEVPADDKQAAAEMIEQGVFDGSEDCVDKYGDPLPEYVEAVTKARAQYEAVS